MTLRQKQSKFAHLVSLLIAKAEELGYEITLGEIYRSPEEALRLSKLGKGIEKSLHTLKLAIDINLFMNGKYLRFSENYRLLGEFWESLSDDKIICFWGGRFEDGNHFSIGHGGRK